MACGLAVQALVNPGDEVIIPVPYWVSYPAMVKLAGGVPVYVEGDEGAGFCVRPEQIADAVTERTRMLMINSPSNPGGFMYSPNQIRAIAEVVSRHDIVVLSDEIYDRLVFGDRRHLSFAAASDDAYGRTITVNSASKTYAMTGWRLGFAAGPADVIKAMAKLQSQATTGAATFAQMAYAHALSSDQSCVEEMRKEYAVRGRHMHARLNEIDGVHCVEPGGAFYCYPNVSGVYGRLGVSGSVEFAERLINEARVAVVPGIAFGTDSHVRLSFATGMERIEEGLSRLSELVRGA
jgi:aspartate aminotransferase